MLSDFETRLDSFPEPWKPEAGAKVVGVVVSVEEHDGGYGSYPLLTIRADDGRELAVHCFHTVLKRELAKLRPAPGDRLGIKYFGRDKDKAYEKYRVIIDRPEVAPDWTAIGAEAEAELKSDAESDDERVL